MSSATDVAVIGAGPYGLSVSAHLSGAGIEHRIFGPPMQTWRTIMPKGMFLKSLDFATSVYSPRPGFSLPDYCRSRGISSAEPIPMELFTEYGLWAQQQLVPHLEPIVVTHLSHSGGTFRLTLSSGEKLTARRVVMAIGLTYFVRIPEALRGLPESLATHTSKHTSYEQFRGQDVAVIGSGQSALEAAVLLHENGARPQVLIRRDDVAFASHTDDTRNLIDRIRMPMSVLGAGRLNFFLQHIPFGAYYMPEGPRIRLTRTHLGPLGAWWLASRFQGKVPVVPRTGLVGATPTDGKLKLRLRDLDDGRERDLLVDHVVAGTGYEPDLAKIPFLDPALASRIERVESSPRLSPSFETSVPDLYFVGAASAFSFGPLFRFVCGAEYAAPTLARHLASRRSGLAHVGAWLYETGANAARRTISRADGARPF